MHFVYYPFDLLWCKEELLPPELVGDVGAAPREVLRHLPGGELRLTHVPKVPGQVDRFA